MIMRKIVGLVLIFGFVFTTFPFSTPKKLAEIFSDFRTVRDSDRFSWKGFDILAQWTGATQQGARTGRHLVEDAIKQHANGIIAGHSEVEPMEWGLAKEELEKEATAGAIKELEAEYGVPIDQIPADIKAERIAKWISEITPEDIDKRMDERINRQILAAHEHNMEGVVVCVGESTLDYLRGLSKGVVKKRILRRLAGLLPEQVAKTVIAYEPKWAITGSGSGVAAKPEDAQAMAEFIKETIRKNWGDKAADNVRIIYGGSANPDNAKDYLLLPDVSGLLIGSASKTAENFLKFVKLAEELGPEANNGKVFYIGANFKQYPYEEIERYVETLQGIDFNRVQVGIAPKWEDMSPLANATINGGD
jgi:triosephosphate isomerase